MAAVVGEEPGVVLGALEVLWTGGRGSRWGAGFSRSHGS